MLKPIFTEDGKVFIIDQTKLPEEKVILEIKTAEEMFEAIKALRVRGAPAIGISGAFGLYLAAKNIPCVDFCVFSSQLKAQGEYLKSSRPTAVNLSWAIDRVMDSLSSLSKTDNVLAFLYNEATKILEEDIASCKKIGEFGAALLKDCHAILTHCNAGSLATGAYGTALSPLYVKKQHKETFKVYSDETRPLLQGSRLTAYELLDAGIDVTVICDNMAGSLMRMGEIDAVIVGADRIAENGDTANKIGTYSLAVLANYHHIPFYVAAPYSTIDFYTKTGNDIPIEQRSKEEVSSFGEKKTAPDGVSIYNPAFDVTPHQLISAIITEKGIVVPPFLDNLKKDK